VKVVGRIKVWRVILQRRGEGGCRPQKRGKGGLGTPKVALVFTEAGCRVKVSSRRGSRGSAEERYHWTERRRNVSCKRTRKSARGEVRGESEAQGWGGG